ncbi:MAG: argininosuccinate lyase [Rhodothermaeota bacterium MED-G64]|nr:MAG: argininosuccinate lyase [Rhodothermaeota bacterium MED-G64]RPF80619.1 MAG: argininosuccinate lyase [Rhodothermaceae bacterium TMED105]HBD42175.1 argininosuccinate lyase [Bacteroidota bacterium]|tara:strand:- start:11591 stop:12952 length:1362 start_codon:yes stop_codon:yes gene_type:complete
MTKLWSKGSDLNQRVHEFTVGEDLHWDKVLAPHDVLGSIAHALMLQKVGLLNESEANAIITHLQSLHTEVSDPSFKIPDDYEDIHSFVEANLTDSLGEIGKKIHTARSRNDQVLLDTKLYLRDVLGQLTTQIEAFITQLLVHSEAHKDILLPGYTHLQLAMPSSFGLWFGAYAESLIDDLEQWSATYRYVNKNPLGSGAGYGSSFPIDRECTTNLLSFESLHVNVVAAQMSRGKTERVVAQSLAGVADTLARMAMDVVLYANPHFGFLSFPESWTTGSSIMPHKKNLDVMELIRGHCNQIKSLPNELELLSTNLPSGYHRDVQLNKNHLFPAIQQLKDCIEIMHAMLMDVEVSTQSLESTEYDELFSVEAVNELVQQGTPFRDAYRMVAQSIQDGTYAPNRQLDHRHIGSLGNLGTSILQTRLKEVVSAIPTGLSHQTTQTLLQPYETLKQLA